MPVLVPKEGRLLKRPSGGFFVVSCWMTLRGACCCCMLQDKVTYVEIKPGITVAYRNHVIHQEDGYPGYPHLLLTRENRSITFILRPLQG